MDESNLDQLKTNMVEIIQTMWDLGLANTTGIAVSCKINDTTILSDRSGTGFRRCNINENDLILINNNCELIDNKNKEGRLAPVNTIVASSYYKANPLAKACIHAHPCYSQAFAITDLPILPYTLQSKILGEVPCVYVNDELEKTKFVKSESTIIVPSGLHSRPDVYYVMEQVGTKVVQTLNPRNQEMAEHGLAITHFEHGIFVFGRSLDEAFENLVRTEANAKQLLVSFGSIIEVKKQYHRLWSRQIYSLNQI